MPDMRGNGIGANVVNSLRSAHRHSAGARSRASVGLTNPMAERRLGFYRRLGFEVIDESYTAAAIRPRETASVPCCCSPTLRTRPRRGDCTLHSQVYGAQF